MVLEFAIKAIASLTVDFAIYCGTLHSIFCVLARLRFYKLPLIDVFVAVINLPMLWSDMRARMLVVFTQQLRRDVTFERVMCVKNLQIIVNSQQVRSTCCSIEFLSFTSVTWLLTFPLKQTNAVDNFADFVVDLLLNELVTSEALTSSSFALLNSDQHSSLIRLFCRVMRAIVTRFADVSGLQVPDVFLGLLQTVETVSHADDDVTWPPAFSTLLYFVFLVNNREGASPSCVHYVPTAFPCCRCFFYIFDLNSSLY